MDTVDLTKNHFSDKLDGLMVVACEHLKSCSESGHLLEVHFFETSLFLKVLQLS